MTLTNEKQSVKFLTHSGKELKDLAAIDLKVLDSLGIFRRGAADEHKLYEHRAQNSNLKKMLRRECFVHPLTGYIIFWFSTV